MTKKDKIYLSNFLVCKRDTKIYAIWNHRTCKYMKDDNNSSIIFGSVFAAESYLLRIQHKEK